MISYILVCAVIAFIVCRKESDLCLWSCCFFLLLSGLGFNINDQYRRGNIMLADIGLVALMVSMILSNQFFHRQMERKKGIMIIIFVLYTLLGLVNPLGGLFRDIKNYLYFMFPAFYFSDIKTKRTKIHCIFITLAISVIYTLYLCLNEFFFVGITLYENDIQKFYGLGLGADFLYYFALLLFINREKVISRISIFGWTILELALLFGAFSGFVRSSWLVMVIVSVLTVVNELRFYKSWHVSISLNSFLNVIITIVLCVFLVNTVLNSIEVDIVGIAKVKFESIDIVNVNEEDTLAARYADIESNLYRLKSPSVIFGYGLGGLINNAKHTLEGSGAENSFLYYVIKFGIVGFVYLAGVILSYIYKKINSQYPMERATACFLLISMIVQSMSGNLNKYYINPFYILLLVVNTQALIDRSLEVSEDEEYYE